MEISVGAILEGTIKSITKFGAFVTLPGVKTTAVRQEAPTSIQCKGTTLTYTYRFDKAVQDVHQAGTYTFTVDLTTGNVSSTVPN